MKWKLRDTKKSKKEFRKTKLRISVPVRNYNRVEGSRVLVLEQ